MGDLSEEQQHMLEVFRKFLQDENLMNHPMIDDYYLLRFLRARKFDFEKTKLMYINHLEWRKENDVDNIIFVGRFL